MKPSMKLAAVAAGIACALAQSGAVAHDNDDRGKVVTVAFGNGINITANTVSAACKSPPSWQASSFTDSGQSSGG